MTSTVDSPRPQGEISDPSSRLPPAFLDATAWKELRTGGDNNDIAAAWLRLQCALTRGVSQAVVVLGLGGQGPYSPAANWPEGTRPSPELIQLAEIGMAERRSIARRDEASACCYLAVPLVFDGQLHGVAALQIELQEQNQLSASLRLLEWGVGQLQVALQRQSNEQGDTLEQDLRRVLANAVACLESDSVAAASSVLVHRLQSEFGAARVMLGQFDGEQVRVTALSGASQVNLKANIVQQIAAAMTEAVDQSHTVRVPAAELERPVIQRAHEELTSGEGYPSMCTVVVRNEGLVTGALTLEREEAFEEEEALQLEQVAAICGPVLEMKRLNDRSLSAVAADRGRGLIQAFFGPRHAALKLTVLVLIALSLGLTLIQGEYRIRAPATLEGALERVVTAPFASYVSTASVRAGDRVAAGDRMAALEVKEVRLDLTRWLSQRAQSERQYLEAVARKERAATQIFKAQMDQADAQIELLYQQVARSQIAAPFAGLVVSGDLSRSIGEPVERGQVLFKLAPIDKYRIALNVDERDVSELEVGQSGELVLASRPGERLAFRVERITPVASASEGVNSFRIEAELLDSGVDLRPGMSGTGKIVVGERSLAWMWTHRMFQWMRLMIWRWMP